MQWFRKLGFRRRYEDLSVSIQEHLEEKVDELMEEGMSREEAMQAARRAFGNVGLIEERSREEWVWPELEGLRADLRYALRQLWKHPGFSLTAMVTLTLGIGANVVVFSVLNALIVRPLNVSDPQRLYNVEHKQHGWYSQSYPDYLDYRDRNRTFDGMVAYDSMSAAIFARETTTKNFGYLASGNYFDVLGVQPLLGRFFHANDEHGTNSAPYIVLSYGFWHARFGGDPNVVGTTVSLNKQPMTVIGVAPKDFHGTEIFYWPDFWSPITNGPLIGYSHHYLDNRSTHNPFVLGKLKAGVTVQQASDDLNSICRQMAEQYPNADFGLDARLVKPGLMGDMWGDSTRNFLMAVMALALLVLLAACANLGSIFAARAADRSRELAIRLAIGSSRWVILRGILAEAILVSLMGGLGGTLVASALLQGLSRWRPFAEFPFHVVVLPDAKVYVVALLLSLGSGILFGLLPGRQIRRSDAAQVMKSNIATEKLFPRFALRDMLLCVQIALCTLLVTASLVALRGMERSLHAPLGFQPRGVVLAGTDLTMAGYKEEQFLPVQKRMLEETKRIPGVSAVGIIDRTILGEGCCGSESVFPAGTTDFRKELFGAHNFSISPEYLAASGMRLLAGRNFTWHDDADSPPVVLVNETFARRMFGSASVVGQHFLLYGGKIPKEVVGVVEDGKYLSLTEDPQPAMFFPLTQEINSNHTVLVVRSTLPPTELAGMLDRTLSNIDRNLPLTLHSWADAMDLAFFPARAATAALGIMGVLAAMLAITGTFGVATYSVSKRMKEFGIRVAVGAARVELVRAALGRPLLLLLSGSIAGLGLGVLASRLLAQIVYEATPRDPLVLGGAIVTMALLALLATWIPARQSMSVEPARLLRED
ncbi:MAG TPA: ABC transporter permease [Candidatus Sulfotelmatobacter sp.]|nr:ABC transporter permease [Candidatus Sulfotelmatobacter sp.]